MKKQMLLRDASQQLLEAIGVTITAEGIATFPSRHNHQLLIEWILKNIFEQNVIALRDCWSVLVETSSEKHTKCFHCECIYQMDAQSKLMVRTQRKIHSIDQKSPSYRPLKIALDQACENYRGLRNALGTFPFLNAFHSLVVMALQSLSEQDKKFIQQRFKQDSSPFMPMYAIRGEFKTQPVFQLFKLQIIDSFLPHRVLGCFKPRAYAFLPAHVIRNDFQLTVFGDQSMRTTKSKKMKPPWIDRKALIEFPQENFEDTRSSAFANAGVFLIVYTCLVCFRRFFDDFPATISIFSDLFYGVIGSCLALPLSWRIAQYFIVSPNLSQGFILSILNSPGFSISPIGLQEPYQNRQIEPSVRGCSVDRPLDDIEAGIEMSLSTMRVNRDRRIKV